MLDLSQLREDIKTEAARLGFNHIGFAPSSPVPHYQDYLAWVEAGFHAEMAYLARQDTLEKRGDPSLILEGCQSIICLAVSYNQPETTLRAALPGEGRISSYARTQDYHEQIMDMLKQLESFIHSRVGSESQLKSYVDTGPVLERAFASQAGLGAVGKNNCLIIPGKGSYLFLAEILTNLPLPPDQPFTSDLCKNCQRCIEACPTACIQPDHTIDASRCISYLTIENKNTIPDNLKDKIGHWLFGCDVCQMVCPHNARPSKETPSVGTPVLPEFLELTQLFSLSESSFKEKFNKTPLTRPKRTGLLRNAAIVLGNQKGDHALPIMENVLKNESDPVILDACGWAVNQIKQNNSANQDLRDD